MDITIEGWGWKEKESGLLIYNFPQEDWRVGRKERKVIANLQLPVEDWREVMEGKESGC